MWLHPNNKVPDSRKFENGRDVIGAWYSAKFDDSFRAWLREATTRGDEVQIQQPKVVGPDERNTDVGIWNDPSGGSALKVLTGFDLAVDSTISTAKT